MRLGRALRLPLPLAGVALVAACRLLEPSAPTLPTGAGAAAAGTAPRVALVRVDERPPLTLVARSGDPQPAVAFAAAHDHGSRASAALVALLEVRLGRLGFPGTESRAHALGFHLTTLVASPGEAGRFVEALSRALSEPVSAGDPALAAVRLRMAGLRAHTFTGPGEAAAAACSGDPGLALAPGEGTDATLAELEAWRSATYSSRAAAFAALGPDPVLAAARQALEGVADWPDASAPNDPWPAADVVAIDPGSSDQRRISIALRVADGGAAIEAARLLGKPGAALETRLDGLEPAWTLERVIGTTRPRGGCVRVDVRGPRGEPAPAIADVARVALLVEEEIERSTARARQSAWSLEDGVLRPTDPRQAAAIAAWRALGGRLEPGPKRTVVSYGTQGGSQRADSNADLLRALHLVRGEWRRPSLEARERVESGQGEVWLLLASPCGSGGETADDAGLTALALRAAAARHAGSDVTLEPWVSAEGIGVLAHGARKGPSETPDQHARRVAAALGRALTARLSGPHVAAARARLLDDLGPGPDPGYWTALEATAPGHPSWIEPRGTWHSITDASSHAVETQRRWWLRTPLRLATIANAGPAQAGAARDELDRWLRPLRASTASCRKTERSAPKTGELAVEVADDDEPRAAAYVAVPLPAGPPPEALWTEHLLNRPSGWLDRALRAPGLAGAARARVRGGPHAAALIIEIGSFDDQIAPAVAQVRALLDRLSRGAARADDLEIAQRELGRARQAEELDPRRRIVDLWRGRTQGTPDLQSLRRFQRALAPSEHVVVIVKRRE